MKDDSSTEPQKNPPSQTGGESGTQRDVEKSSGVFPIVALGASAGGLEALEEFFRNMPADCGLGFVVVTHLDPHHKTMMPELLAKCTEMPVHLAEEGVEVQPEAIYVIPANAYLSIADGHLHLEEPLHGRGQRHPIDYFFRSLAQDQQEKACAVILSGTGTDGSAGIRDIKACGGLVVVQEESSARYSGMPKSAIDSGLADLVLPIEKMPAQIVDLMRRPRPLQDQREAAFKSISDRVRDICQVLKRQCDADFSSYKINTLVRRIERRMMVNNDRDINDYLERVSSSDQECRALFQELLIGVTSFFRDPEAFKALRQQVIVPLVERYRDKDEPLRIWIPGCSTGEEAYSLAIYLREEADLGREEVQIFATDIDETAILRARSGCYPQNIAENVPEPLLKKYFRREDDHYRIVGSVRELVIFAPHNLLKDPPFSNLDLICCRNLLIYLDADLQKKTLPLFHHSLKPGGFLFLGPSETVGSHRDLFEPINKKWKIFAWKMTDKPVVSDLPSLADHVTYSQRRKEREARPQRKSPAEIGRNHLLQRYLPPSVVVNEKHEVLHTFASTVPYLEQPVGDPTLNVLKLARKELRPVLRAALHQVFSEKTSCAYQGVRVGSKDDEHLVNIVIDHIAEDEDHGELAVIAIEPQATAQAAQKEGFAGNADKPLVEQLEKQLKTVSEQLHANLEESEQTEEELKTSNEELMSMNEELQSANEELETSKEELQALNEELVTVNSELQSKMEELSESNNDLQNLINSSQIATVFLDKNLCIKRYTPGTGAIFSLLPNDLGRPISDIATNLDYSGLTEDAERVLAKLKPVEREVRAKRGDHYLLRMLPYRTVEDVIEGVVLVFFEITERKEAEAQILKQRRIAEERARQAEESERTLHALMEQVPQGMTIADAGGTVRMISRYGLEMVGEPLEKLLRPPIGKHGTDWHLFHLDGKTPAAGSELPLARALRNGEVTTDEEWMLRPPGREPIAILCSAGPIRDSEGTIVGGVIAWQDISERRRLEDELRSSEERLRIALAAGKMGTWEWNMDTGEVTWNAAQYQLCGIDPSNRHLKADSFFALVHPDDREELKGRIERSRKEGADYMHEFRIRRLDGTECWLAGRGTIIRDPEGHAQRMIGINYDITARKNLEKNLERVSEQRRLALESTEMGTWEMDPASGTVCWDRRCQAMFDASEENIPYEKILDLIHPEDREKVDKVVRQVFNPLSDGQLSVEYRIALPGKPLRWVMATGQVFFVGKKEERLAGRMVGTLLDITERRQREEELSASEARLVRALEASRMGVWEMDLESRKAFRTIHHDQIFGYDVPLPDWSYDRFLKHVLPEDREVVDAKFRRALAENQSWNFECRIRRADDKIRWIEATGQRHVKAGGGARMIGTVSDITERKTLEESLRRAQREAEEGSRVKSRFLATMSHELRTPLTVVLSAFDQIRQCEDLEERRRYLEMAETSSQMLLDLVDNVLDLAKIEANKLELEEKDFELPNAVREVVSSFFVVAGEKSLDVKLNIRGNVPPFVRGDAKRLRQILFNLIGNAIKFTESGHIEISLQGDEPDHLTHTVRFAVKDTGIGLPEGKLDEIFQSFSQGDSTTTRRFGGTGLGLAISKELTEAMGGTIWAESERGAGSSFYFTIPFQRAAIAGKKPVPEEKKQNSEVKTSCRVLLAEDDRMIRELMEVILTKNGFEIVCATDGEAAVELWEKDDFDLILMDVQMPNMDGHEATRTIRSREEGDRRIPIIGLTAHALSEDQQAGLNSGMDAYLTKPLNIDRLFELVEMHANCRPSRRS